MGTDLYLVSNRANRPIASDVLIAPHHGGDDGSSEDLINGVNARWVIFSAGHDNHHPLQVTADRYIGLGYTPQCLLRTDLGDDEPGNDEWDHGRINNASDPILDNNIEIRLPDDGSDPVVRYVGQPQVVCPDLGLSLPTIATPAIEIRMSRSQICHEPSSSNYATMIHFTVFNSLQACLDVGGRERR